jgi:hypothetical protein
MDDAFGVLIAVVVGLTLVALVVVYVILPLLAIIAVGGLGYGGFFALRNYGRAVRGVIVEGNRA